MSSAELEQMIRRVVREERGSGSDELITIAQAAALANYGVTKIRGWLKAGTLKRYGEGRGVRINKAQLLEVLANPTGKPAAMSPDELARKILKERE
jgi:excisionase family DNA binding protein